MGLENVVASALNLHPYYPTSAALPGWQPLQISYEKLVGGFFAFFGVLGVGTWIWTGRNKQLPTTERLIVIWFLSCFIIHTVIEGAVVVNGSFYTDASGNFLNEIWKEYGKADSRYLTRDAFTVCMEAFTAFVEGPCSLLIVLGVALRAPWRYTLAILVSFGELYGNILYLSTSFYDGLIYCRPEPYYFWFYFIFLNGVWIVVPIAVIYWAAARISTSVQSFERPAGVKTKGV